MNSVANKYQLGMAASFSTSR